VPTPTVSPGRELFTVPRNHGFDFRRSFSTSVSNSFIQLIRPPWDIFVLRHVDAPWQTPCLPLGCRQWMASIPSCRVSGRSSRSSKKSFWHTQLLSCAFVPNTSREPNEWFPIFSSVGGRLTLTLNRSLLVPLCWPSGSILFQFVSARYVGLWPRSAASSVGLNSTERLGQKDVLLKRDRDAF